MKILNTDNDDENIKFQILNNDKKMKIPKTHIDDENITKNLQFRWLSCRRETGRFVRLKITCLQPDLRKMMKKDWKRLVKMKMTLAHKQSTVMCLGFNKIQVSENLGRFCAIVVYTILSGMLEDSSRAHSGDILTANSAVTAGAENPFITWKLPFSPSMCFKMATKLTGLHLLFGNFAFSSLSLPLFSIYWTRGWQYWIYLIPPDWVLRHI